MFVKNVFIFLILCIKYVLLFFFHRQEVIERLQNQHTVVILVTNSLTSYMEKVRQLVKENPEIDANTFMPDNRYNHIMQVQERLNFLRFLLKVSCNIYSTNNNKFQFILLLLQNCKIEISPLF